MKFRGPQPVSQMFELLGRPDKARDLKPRDWNRILPYSFRFGVVGRLAARIDAAGGFDELPEPVRRRLEGALLRSARQERLVRWELNRLERALADLDVPVVLLKGSAYLAAGLPASAGRVYNDVDLLVPLNELTTVERRLLEQGWLVNENDHRHRRYFREWLHELPPFVHPRRGMIVDLHHAILPRTDRLQPDMQLLWDASIALPDVRWRVFQPVDMVLHSMAHQFRNGDFTHAVRDLSDLDDLMRTFAGRDADFWTTLRDRTIELGLQTPAYWGVRYCRALFDTPVPAALQESAERWRPIQPLHAVFDRLVSRAMYRTQLDRTDRAYRIAVAALAFWPVPRFRAFLSPLFWMKRFPSRVKPRQSDEETEEMRERENG